MLRISAAGSRDVPSGKVVALEDSESTWLTIPTPSCLAIKQALCSLFRLDDFNHEPIGSGFFSQVYKVIHRVTNQVLVLKINTQPSNRSNVLREIQILSRLSHPNVIRLYGVCVNEGELHALIEYVNGGNLEQLIADKSVDLQWAVRIRLACDIAKGLKYMHSRGIMHRDLTSKNILVKKLIDGRTVAIVADFGLATTIPDPRLNKSLPIVGSPYWMAPECIRGYKYNEKADVFSYGIILCELIGRVCADPEILPRTSKFGVDYVAFSKMASDCPLHFLHLTFICCQIDPNKRPSSNELVKSLEMMKYSALMAVMLADLGRLNISRPDHAIDRALLEDILDVKRHRRTQSVVQQNTGSVFSTPTSGVAQPSDVHRRVVPVTPLIIGQVMSQDDVDYAPRANTNPFSSHFLDSAVKVVDGIQMSLPDGDSPLRGLESGQHFPRQLVMSRSLSLPSSPSMSLDSGAMVSCCLAMDSSDEATSSADSALDRDVIVKCMEDFEVLFDDDELSHSLTDDSSSAMSSTLDDIAGLQSPIRNVLYSDRSELSSSMWHERFQRLLCHWQTRQLDVNAARLPPRLRLAFPYLVHRFAELRRLWEENQFSTPSSLLPERR